MINPLGHRRRAKRHAGRLGRGREKVTVFAAASLTNTLQEIATHYKKKTDIEGMSSFASSFTVARQIEQSAPADLFISSDQQQWMDDAVSQKSMDESTRVTLLGNELVLVALRSYSAPTRNAE